MNTDEIISFAKQHLRQNGLPATWNNIALFVAEMHSFHLRGYKLQDEALARFLNGTAPVKGAVRDRDVD